MTARLPTAQRGDVWLAEPSPNLLGHEQALRGPIVVVSSNRYTALSTLLALPLTTRDRGSPLHIAIVPPEAGVRSASFAMPEQLRVIDRSRLVEHWGRVSAATLGAIEDRLRLVLEL